MGGPNSSLFDWDADIMRTVLQHSRHAVLLCGEVLNTCDRATVCPCAADRSRRRSAVAHVFHEALPLKERAVLQLRPDADGLPALTAPPMCGSLPEQAQLQSAIGRSLSPSSAHKSQRRSTTQPADAIRTTSVSFQRFSTATQAGEVAPHAPWSPVSLNVSPPSTTQATSSSSLPSAVHRDSARAMCDVCDWLPQETVRLHNDQMTGGQPGTTPTLANGPSHCPTRSDTDTTTTGSAL